MASKVVTCLEFRPADQSADLARRPTRVFEVELQRRVGALSLDVRFTLSATWTVLFAPSGAGKTSILRMLAGLDQPDSGRIVSRRVPPAPREQHVLTESTDSLFVPPHQRKVHMVTQSPALFPHLSVLGNVGFGIGGSPELKEYLQTALQLCRVSHLVKKRPAELSGGESQRVALARAIAGSDFHLLLLDEPFTGLEADLRGAILTDLRAHLARHGIPVLQVTHDVGEIFFAEAEVLRLEAGRIVAQGPAEVVLAREREALLARLQPGS